MHSERDAHAYSLRGAFGVAKAANVTKRVKLSDGRWLVLVSQGRKTCPAVGWNVAEAERRARGGLAKALEEASSF